MKEVDFAGVTLQLYAQGAAFWPARSTLLVADLHLGKASTFRRHGIPVPTGSSAATLAKVSQLLTTTGASRLTILGDMFHAASSLTDEVRRQLRRLFGEHCNVHVTLIRGNHDARIHFWDGWPVEVIDDIQIIDRVAFTHHPDQNPDGADLVVCGHIHPAVRLGGREDQLGKLPCFYFSDDQLVLPALGEFTGTHEIKRKSGDRIWVVAEESLIEV
jgi:DNA ligase-associated metallophosphoesterase